MTVRSYLDRPAKWIERLMLAEAFRRLVCFGPLGEYAYLGFGSHEFVDFELLWRTLGITRMTSIEKETPVDRFEFNRPFGSIVVEPGESFTVLPRIVFGPHTIVWLDYTDKLTVPIINDVRDCARRLGSGSALVVTVNVANVEKVPDRRAAVVKAIEERRIPATETDDTLAKWGLARLCRDVLVDEVTQAMRDRIESAKFEQLFHFHYADRSKMLTWGGVILADEDRQAFEEARFGQLDFVRTGADPLLLAPPSLTLREVLKLNEALPLTAGTTGPLSWMTSEELEAYARLHRWYPSLP
jgi:hypothetical protein